MKSKLFFAALAAGAGICAFAQSADELNVEKLTAKLAETKAENWWQIGNLQVKLELAKKTPENPERFRLKCFYIPHMQNICSLPRGA